MFQCLAWQSLPQYAIALHRVHRFTVTPSLSPFSQHPQISNFTGVASWGMPWRVAASDDCSCQKKTSGMTLYPTLLAHPSKTSFFACSKHMDKRPWAYQSCCNAAFRNQTMAANTEGEIPSAPRKHISPIMRCAAGNPCPAASRHHVTASSNDEPPAFLAYSAQKNWAAT
jgi:hypothetical protein